MKSLRMLLLVCAGLLAASPASAAVFVANSAAAIAAISAGVVASSANSVGSTAQQPTMAPANVKWARVGYLICVYPSGGGCYTGSDWGKLVGFLPWLEWMRKHAGDDAQFMGMTYMVGKGRAIIYYGVEAADAGN